MELLKLLNTSEIFAQIISFLILIFFFRKFAWKNILGMLDERKKKIASDLKSIEDAKEELVKLKSEYEAKLASIDEIARGKIKEAIEEARKIGEEIKARAQKEAEEATQRSRENIRQELLKARQELKGQIVELALKATETIVLEKLTAECDRKLVEDFLEKIDKA